MNPKDLVGAKKAPLKLVPPALVIGVAEAMQNGADKYGPYNFRDYPVEMMTYVEAAERHLLAFADGQDFAEDTGIHHLKHAAAGIAILLDGIAMGTVIDNRPPKGPAAALLRAQDRSVKPGEVDPLKVVFEATAAPKLYDLPEPHVTKFLCGHSFGEEPLSDCGTAIHWSRVNGIERRPSDNEGLGDICADQGHHLPGLHNLSCPEFA